MMTSLQKDRSQAARPKRSRKMQPLAESLGRLTRELCSKQGFAQSEIITRWAEIVGPALAAHSLPDRLTFPKGQPGGTLHILADSAFAVELQYLAPQAIERINGYFGFPAVARLSIRQGPVAMRARRRRRPLRPQPEDRTAAAREAAAIRDNNLRAALVALGAAMIADSRQKRR